MTQHRFWLILTLILLPAASLRVAGMFDDFWLDEIWSYNTARHLTGPADVLFSATARIDNNHPVNTLLIWLVGDRTNWYVYRIPSLIAGLASLGLVVVIMRRRGELPALLATMLVAFSFPLIFYSSEARGYSLAVMFALLAFDVLERFLAKSTWAAGIVFWAACGLGILSHLSFIHAYLGMLVWSGIRLRKTPGNLAQLHAIPLIGIVLIYGGFVRHLVIGGSPAAPVWQAVTDAICGLIAIPGPTGLELLLMASIVAGLVWLIVGLRRAGSDWWIVILIALVISPALAIAWQSLLLPADKHQPIAPRYFLVALPFVLMAAGWICATTRRKPLAIGGIAVFLAMNVVQTVQFLRVGRGHYSEAVIFMSENTAAPQITVLADNAYRTGLPLDFYARLLPANKRLIVYRPQDTGQPVFDHGPPVWLIRHSNLTDSPPAQRYDVNGMNYRFEREFPYYGLSGYTWYLYRRSDS